MKILTVIPIGKGIPRDELSYFSARDVQLGTIVTVPFGGRKIKGVVADAHDVRDLKTSIKNKSYALKNISEVHADARLPKAVFEAAQKTARFFAARIGAVLETVVPNVLMEVYVGNVTERGRGPKARARNSAKSFANGNRGQENLDTPEKIPSDIAAMQIPFAERILAYKTMIRENFAKQKSTMIVTATIAETERLADLLKTGIEDRIFSLHGKKTKKSFGKNVASILETPEPCVVIATAAFASLARDDWRDIIIERAGSQTYRYGFGVSFDLKFFVEHCARAVGARAVFADTILPAEIRYRIARKDIHELRSTWHIAKPEDFKIIDMKPKEDAPKQSFQTLSSETVAMISRASGFPSRTLLLAARKGLAPMTICSDCGTIVSCPNCGTPLVLHRTKQKSAGGLRPPAPTARTYLCHHCNFQTLPTDFCAACHGSRFALLGITTESIREEILEKFPRAKVFVLEREGEQSISKTLKSWNKDGGILITTPSLLDAIDSADFGCVVSLDALLSLPTYTASETSLATLLQFLEKIYTTPQPSPIIGGGAAQAIIQTRNINHEVIQSIASENLLDFMQNEIALRTQFHYPPAKILAKISLVVPASEAQNAANYFENLFQAHDPDLMIKRALKPDHITVTAVMKLDPDIWNDFSSPIHDLFDSLPPETKKEINPDSVI